MPDYEGMYFTLEKKIDSAVYDMAQLVDALEHAEHAWDALLAADRIRRISAALQRVASCEAEVFVIRE